MKLYKRVGRKFKEATLQEIRAHYNALKLDLKKGDSITTVSAALKLIKGLGDLVTEHTIVLYLDNSNKLLVKDIITNKLEDQCPVHPRRILRIALQNYATGILVCHNHPSGGLAPSDADNKMTNKLVEAAELLGIRFVDHIIVTDTDYYSYKMNNML